MINRTWLQMGMPVNVCICDEHAGEMAFEVVKAWFDHVDERYSPFKPTSDVSRFNTGQLPQHEQSEEFRGILALCEATKRETYGYFDVEREGAIDPSGLVKGWAIERAGELMVGHGYENFYIDAGGDIRVSGLGPMGNFWKVGVRNPFAHSEIIKVLEVTDCGVATSGTAVRGDHIYDPFENGTLQTDLISLTVVGPNILDADRFATAAFAMGERGVEFIERTQHFEGYAISKNGIATSTSGFSRFVK